MDGKILARARERLEAIKQANADEQARRHAQVCADIPQMPEIEAQMRRLFAQVLAVTLREKTRPEEALREIDEKSAALRRQKEDLLTAAGYAGDYLDDLYNCTLCHDSGYLKNGKPCVCLTKLYRLEQAKELSSLMGAGEVKFADFDLGYYDTHTDPNLGVSPRECMQLVLHTCEQYAESFGANSRNLLFMGGTGLGKTFLSACIARTVAERGISVVYETAVSAFEAFENRKFSRDTEQSTRAVEHTGRILACELLILDDLGTEMLSSFTQSALYTVVNTRLAEGRKTIISTNLSHAELTQRYSAQTVSRIDGEYDTLMFAGSDIRALKKERRYT